MLLLGLLPFHGVLLAFSLRSASSLSFGRGDKDAESGDIDDKYHHNKSQNCLEERFWDFFIPFVYYLYYID